MRPEFYATIDVLQRMRPALVMQCILLCVPAEAQLREAGAERGIKIGAAVDPARFSEPAYAMILGREFSQAEPENAMKFGPIHPAPNVYNFSGGDAVVNFAAVNQMAVRGHTLVWHNQNPPWLINGGFTPAQLSQIMQDHIHAVMQHYAGSVYAWDVVNEAFNDDGSPRGTIWASIGPSYLETAFRAARDADRAALLFYNDYNIETTGAKSNAVFQMAQGFLARGVPLDGIGLQAHLTAGFTNFASLDANMKRFTDLGLQVQITELDVRLALDSKGNPSVADLFTQAQIYGEVVRTCLKYPLCTAVQMWGVTDKYSWIPGAYPGFGGALLFDASYLPKPAYGVVERALCIERQAGGRRIGVGTCHEPRRVGFH